MDVNVDVNVRARATDRPGLRHIHRNHIYRRAQVFRAHQLGQQISVVGPMHELDWRAALEGTLLPKLDSGCELLAFVKW